MPIHEEKAAYDSWFRVLFLIPSGLFIASAVLAGRREFDGAWVTLAEAAIFILIFYCILPRKYQIYDDRLRIVLGPPFAINIPLSTIREAGRLSGRKAFVYGGIRFATSTKYVMEIVRSKGMNYVISPQNGDLFLDILNQAVGRRNR